MASQPSAILSETLLALTSVKFDEINKQRQQHAEMQRSLFQQVDATESELARIETLIEAISDPAFDVSLSSAFRGRHNNVGDIKQLVELSKHDASVPSGLLSDFEARLRKAWTTKSRTFDFARLYAKLLREWIEPKDAAIDPAVSESPQVRESDDDYQVIERDRLEQLRVKFAGIVFAPLKVDAAPIEKFLGSIFDNDDAAASLHSLRLATCKKGAEISRMHEPFQVYVVRNCIKGLLVQDLLNDEKKTTLQDFTQNETVLREVADVLNLRFADLANWTWNAPRGLPVEPRRQLNGKWRIMADEDILQAIFLHFVAMQWATFFKAEFKELLNASSSRYHGVYNPGTRLPKDTADSYEYFNGSAFRQEESLQQRQNAEYQQLYLDSLPDDLEDVLGPYDDQGLNSSLASETTSPLKQKILRRLAADVLIQQELHGEVATAQGDLQWYAPSLPHSTILTVMRFFGMPEMWLDFFTKYLEAPLNMQAGIDGGPGQVQVRKRGTPIASALATFIGELVLMPVDLAVNHRTGLHLYRMHDDLWMSGSPADVATGWTTIEDFVSSMGLELNKSKCGSVYLTSMKQDDTIVASLPQGPVEFGFLRLDAASGKWQISQENVTAHINQLRTQLSACTSVLSWVTTWNSCIGRFFNFSFGQPAAVFGRSHVDLILQTHGRIQKELFRDQNDGHSQTVNDYLRKALADRFDLEPSDIPDAFLFLPQSLGGLGLRNPFVPLIMLRNGLSGEPEDEILAWRQSQRQRYDTACKSYNELHGRSRVERLRQVYDLESDEAHMPTKESAFPSFEQWSAYPEQTDTHLARTFERLLQLPAKINLRKASAVDVRLNDDEEWIVEMYAQDLDRLFSGTRIVKRSLLPSGVLEIMNERTDTWSIRL